MKTYTLFRKVILYTTFTLADTEEAYLQGLKDLPGAEAQTLLDKFTSSKQPDDPDAWTILEMSDALVNADFAEHLTKGNSTSKEE